MDELKNLSSHSLIGESDQDLLIGAVDLIDSNFQDFSNIPHSSDDTLGLNQKNSYSSSSASTNVFNNSAQHKTSTCNYEHYNTNSKNNTVRFESLNRSLNNSLENNDSKQIQSDKDSNNATNLAIKYNELSENKQNELVILQKLEYFLLKFKW